jgi:hypothetical protein
MPTLVRTKTDESQRFRVEETDLPGQGVSGIMDERPEVDSGWLRHTRYQHCRRVNGSAAIGLMSNHVIKFAPNSRVLNP